jgi:hypothetical protein
MMQGPLALCGRPFVIARDGGEVTVLLARIALPPRANAIDAAICIATSVVADRCTRNGARP